jgi:hypothetical protein
MLYTLPPKTDQASSGRLWLLSIDGVTLSKVSTPCVPDSSESVRKGKKGGENNAHANPGLTTSSWPNRGDCVRVRARLFCSGTPASKAASSWTVEGRGIQMMSMLLPGFDSKKPAVEGVASARSP